MLTPTTGQRLQHRIQDDRINRMPQHPSVVNVLHDVDLTAGIDRRPVRTLPPASTAAFPR